MTYQHDPLYGVRRLGLDTAPFIYLIERNVTYLARARAVFRLIDNGVITGYSSVMTLTEVLTQPLQTNDHIVAAEYRRFLLDSQNLFLAPITPAIAERCREMNQALQLLVPVTLALLVSATTPN